MTVQSGVKRSGRGDIGDQAAHLVKGNDLRQMTFAKLAAINQKMPGPALRKHGAFYLCKARNRFGDAGFIQGRRA